LAVAYFLEHPVYHTIGDVSVQVNEIKMQYTGGPKR